MLRSIGELYRRKKKKKTRLGRVTGLNLEAIDIWGTFDKRFTREPKTVSEELQASGKHGQTNLFRHDEFT